MKIKINKVLCKQALSKSGIGGFDYSMNPYVGCEHACVYCYASFVRRWRKKGFDEKWGGFVDVKINYIEALTKQLPKLKPGRVMISSICDAYQPLEKKYKLTRRALQKLAEAGFTIGLLTKNDLILRDIDILKRFGKNSDIGFTICFNYDEDRKNFEPNSSSIEARFKALKKLKQAGIKTCAFLGPFIPVASEKGLDELFRGFKDVDIDYLLFDKLNLKGGNWPAIRAVLEQKYNLKDPKNYLSDSYYSEIKKKVKELARKYNLKLEIVYR